MHFLRDANRGIALLLKKQTGLHVVDREVPFCMNIVPYCLLLQVNNLACRHTLTVVTLTTFEDKGRVCQERALNVNLNHL